MEDRGAIRLLTICSHEWKRERREIRGSASCNLRDIGLGDSGVGRHTCVSSDHQFL